MKVFYKLVEASDDFCKVRGKLLGSPTYISNRNIGFMIRQVSIRLPPLWSGEYLESGSTAERPFLAWPEARYDTGR